MVAKFQFLLDKQYVDDPKNWDDLDTTIKRDQAISGLLIAQESQLEFYGNGYDYIKQQFDTQGFCSFIEIEIRQTCDQLNYEPIFNGIIYLSDCIFDLMRCSVKVKTVDDGFYARINNNKSIKAKLDVGRSKNYEESVPATHIAPAASIVVHFFRPVTGAEDQVASGNPCNVSDIPTQTPNCFTVYECFRFLVAFMSDGNIDFTSNVFGVGGKWEGICLTIGNEVRLCDQSIIPEISFQELFTELNKKLQLGFSIETISGRTTLRVEDWDYFYGQSSVLTLLEAKEVVMQMDSTKLYAKVHLGSSITFNDPMDACFTPQFPEDINFLGFKDETYHIIGTCNVDTTLELNSQWIVSSNVIENIFVAGDSSHDNEIILVHVDMSNPAHYKAVKTNWLDQTLATPVYYNEIFNNQNVTLNWFNGIPNQIAQFLGSGNNEFKATLTTTYKLGNGNVRCDNDSTLGNFDTGANYDNTIYEYVAPQSGVFTFFASALVSSQHFTAGNSFIEFGFQRFDSFSVFIEGIVIFHRNISGVSGVFNDSISLTHTFNLNMGDKLVFVGFRGAGIDCYVHAGAIFSCTATETGGGIVGTSDPANYKIKKYSFKYPLTFQNLKTIKADTKKLITFTTNNGVQQTGWIDTIKYYHHNKVADITLITN